MHPTPAQSVSPPIERSSFRWHSKSAFSLVEVTLAIGIIAFAFVALFALVPTGLTTFRTAIDTSNETWIMQNINSMVQTTNYSDVPGLSFEKSGEIYYFDEEGKLTDTETKKGSDDVQQTRLYSVKLVVDTLNRPAGSSAALMNHGLRVIAVFAPYGDPSAKKDFESVTDAQSLTSLTKQTRVRNRSFVVARMDSQ